MMDRLGTLIRVKDQGAARAAFDAYVATEESRVDDFRRIVESRGGPPAATLDLSRDSLGPLGAWLLRSTPPGPEDAGKPIWAWNRADDDPYLRGSWLVDGLATYLVAMLRRRRPSGLAWKLETDRRSIYGGYPVLLGLSPIEVFPYSSALGLLRQARNASPADPAWLVAVHDRWLAQIRQTAETDASDGRPLDTDAELEHDLDDVTVESFAGDPDWNAELMISEAAETVLGTDAFDGLSDRFAAIPGVERIAWEDRERFLLRLGRGVDPADVRGAARQALRDARPPRA
jgi:hypothetical protein